MCGISGIVDFSGPRVSSETLVRMTDAIRHRGPDDFGEYISPNGVAGLGFRRLSIIDLSTGHQPLSNEDGTVWIEFNGEIYNFQDARTELLGRGHKFKTRTDTETIVHLYEEYGSRAVEYLRGMFAFALWDETRQSLFAARDRVGKKPFFYTLQNGKFIFASELKAILSIIDPPELDPDALDLYLTFGYVPHPLTIYRGIFKLPPGHWLRYSRSGLETERYWNLTFDPQEPKDEETLLKEVESLLRESVRLRLMSDVPLGALLSGGVDSSLIVALMAQEGGRPPKTFSLGFEESDYSELAHARTVARHIGAEHHEQVVRPDALDLIEELAAHYEEPFADSSMIPTYLVCKHARQHLTVALSGDGGDEVFGGYPRYKYESMIGSWMRVPGASAAARLLSRVYPKTMRGALQLQKMKFPEGRRYAEQVSVFGTEFRNAFYNPSFARTFSGEQMMKEIYGDLARQHASEALGRMQYVDTVWGWLPGDMLTKVDMAAMYASLEVRCPLLDQKLIEYMSRVPARFKLHNGESKYILKRLAERLVPREVLYRPKQGFSLPLPHWFRNELRSFVLAMLVSPDSRIHSLFRSDAVRQLVDDHMEQRWDYSGYIFCLLSLELWLRRHSSDVLQRAAESGDGAKQRIPAATLVGEVH